MITEKNLAYRLLLQVRFIAFCVIICTACGGLPDDFGSLTLEEQIAAYERNFDRYGGPLIEARTHISLHGLEAADLMAKYISGERIGLPKREAIRIVHDIQQRGCSLRGTAAEQALKEFLETAPAGTVDAEFAKNALYSISNNIVTRGDPDPLEGGPCEAAKVLK